MGSIAKKLAVSTIALALLAGCTTNSQDAKVLGQLGGALAGGLLGNQFGGGTGRLIATVAGAAVGAWIGGEIAKALTERDQAALKTRSQAALASVPDGQTITWTAPESGKTVRITPSATREESRPVELKRITRVSPPPAGFKMVRLTLEATTDARLRATPSTNDNNVVGGFKKGDIIKSTGQVADGKWYLVTRQDTAIGYIAASVVKPATQTAAARPPSVPTLEGGVDLDTVETMKVDAKVTCRTVTYNLDEGKPQAVDSCKASDGAWNLG